MMYIVKSQNSSFKSKKGGVIFVIIIFAVVATLEAFWPHFLPALATSIASPFWRAEFSIESGSLESPQQLLAENESLKRQIDQLKLNSADIQAVVLENTELKSLLGRNVPDEIASSSSSTNAITQNSIAKNRVLAPVLIRPPFAPYDEYIIDGGANLGFSIGDRVFASENVPIGSIAAVLANTSRVTLYSSPGQSYQVLVGPASIIATALGRGGGQYSAEVPRSANITSGDFVIAPSLYDQPFGIVKAVISDPSQPFQTVLFAPPVNPFQARWVLVEKTKI